MHDRTMLIVRNNVVSSMNRMAAAIHAQGDVDSITEGDANNIIKGDADTITEGDADTIID